MGCYKQQQRFVTAAPLAAPNDDRQLIHLRSAVHLGRFCNIREDTEEMHAGAVASNMHCILLRQVSYQTVLAHHLAARVSTDANLAALLIQKPHGLSGIVGINRLPTAQSHLHPAKVPW